MVVLLLAVLSLLPSTSAQPLTFTAVPQNGNASVLFQSTDQWLRPFNTPVTYVTQFYSNDQDNNWVTAPAGSFFLWGTQPDMSISTDLQTWWYTSGTADTNSHIDPRDIPLNFPSVLTSIAGIPAPGNAMCNHRTTFNRFYLMGNVNGKTNPYPVNTSSIATNGTKVNIFFNWATNDGQIWTQVMSNASSYNLAIYRNLYAMTYPWCVVDQKERVYLVGGSDTWMSSDLGVNFNAVTATTFPTPGRYNPSGAIYSPTTTTDTMVVIGGRAFAGQWLNDVWTSTNGAVSWTNIGSGPWIPRQDGVFAINNNGVMVYLGGSCGGGYCGVYSDAYVSVNGGSQWYLLAVAPTVNVNITLAASVFDAQGYLWLVTGQTVSGNNNYFWTNTVQRSSLSFSTSAITQWSSTLTGGQQFTTSATAINALNQGAWPQGGNKTATPSAIVPISAFTCLNSVLPIAGPFNLTYLDGGNGWQTADVGLAQTVQSIVYQNVYSANVNPIIDPYTGYYIGSSWSVAPAGSWLIWGSNPDVAISTNLGTTWSNIAGVGGGLGEQSTDYNTGSTPDGATRAGYGNAQCAHRNTFNRFYVIGNNQYAGNTSYPFFAWAADEGQTWTQVMDAASGVAMAADNATASCQCWVDRTDVVWFMSGNAVWYSNTLGRAFTRLTSTNYPTPVRQQMASVIFAPTASTETVVVVGGTTLAGVQLNDVWSTTNNGQSWTQMTANAAFSPRCQPQMAIAANGAIVLQGGMQSAGYTFLSDMWVSVNYGTTWYQLAASTPITRAQGAAIFDPYGYFYVDSGRSAASWQSDVWKSSLSINNIGSWGSSLIPGFVAPTSYACTQANIQYSFDFVSTPGSPGYGAIDQFIRVFNAPTGYVTGYGSDNMNQWAVAPAGSWLIFGTQPDVSISTNNGAGWTITSGTANSNSHLDTRDIPPNFPSSGNAGNAGCGHRTTFNRFYLLGTAGGQAGGGGTLWFNWATHDGSVWYQVMTNASSYAMSTRTQATSPGSYAHQCFVDQAETVYSVARGDTWRSTDLGVSWSPVVAATYFPSRLNFAGAIYSPDTSTDVMVIMGGEGAQDAWRTMNGGLSWTVLSSALPWGNRGNLNFGVSQNLVFVVMGGDCRSASCGPGGNMATAGLTVYNDVWLSVSYGASWTLATAATSAPVLSLAAVAFDSLGFMYIVAGEGSGYGAWTNAQYKSTLSLYSVNTWGPRLSNGTQFSASASFNTPTSGAYSLGGPKGQTQSAVVALSNFPCGALYGLPVPSTAAPFDFTYVNNVNGWPTNDIGLTVIPSPITYEVAYTNTSYGQYWQGNAWRVAPAGSWLIWGSQPDVTISTNQGQSWTTIAGITGAGFPNTSTVDYAPNGALVANAECAHRSTVNRFYIIGNNDPIGTYTVVPFFAWASDDGLTWTQVMDNATSYAMAVTPDIASGQCVVGVNDVVYYLGGAAMWQSGNLGVTFTPITPAAGAYTYLNYTALGARENPTAVIYSPTPGKDNIVVLGGGGGLYAAFGSDVWQTTDYGTSWQALTLRAGWSPRQSPQVAIGENGVMVLYGGMAYTASTVANSYGWSWFSDVWVSLNGGSQWYLLNGNSAAGNRAYGGMIVDRSGYLFVSSGSSIWSNWLTAAYKSQYSLYNIQQWLPVINASIPIPAALCPSAAAATDVGYLCMISYSLPGNVDYPWSSATSMTFQYVAGTSSVTILSGSGTRTYTNRFATSTVTPFTVAPVGTGGSDNVLYLGGTTTPFDVQGLTLNMATGVQLPGNGPLTFPTISIRSIAGQVMEAFSSRVDVGGTAFVSNVPGFVNITIGASNLNALAPMYSTCQAPITFTNGLRPFLEPNSNNGARTFRFVYTVSDGMTYSIVGNLTFTATSGFATDQDQLGNPYQTIVGVTGTRTYTYLPTGAMVNSTVSGLSTQYGTPDQRWYPYTLLGSSPGVYTPSTAPYLSAPGSGVQHQPGRPRTWVRARQWHAVQCHSAV